jgi:hypothetical protein
MLAITSFGLRDLEFAVIYHGLAQHGHFDQDSKGQDRGLEYSRYWKTEEVSNIRFELRLRYPQRMSFRVEHPVIKTDQIRWRKDKVEVLQCLSQPEALITGK